MKRIDKNKKIKVNYYTYGKIYKITDNTNNNTFVDYTILNLSDKLKIHEGHLKYGDFITEPLFGILQNNDYSIDLIYNYSCKNEE